ncbi:DUF4265 domain-containing protein [Actinomadura madurae]|uniref:hypothetical protein n=1 Tax=Actinomadura madurae TaxID=1993 RepID=UPI00399972C7
MTADRDAREHVKLWACAKSNGEPVYELVAAERLPDGRYKILVTPALVLGCAAGDIVIFNEVMRAQLLHRGGTWQFKRLRLRIRPHGC